MCANIHSYAYSGVYGNALDKLKIDNDDYHAPGSQSPSAPDRS